MASPSKQISNLQLHAPFVRAIAEGAKEKRNEILKSASPALVEALATGVRLLDEHGVKFARGHMRRARRMMSKNTSKKTKKELVSGAAGKVSRGGGFWKDVGSALIKVAPAAVPLLL